MSYRVPAMALAAAFLLAGMGASQAAADVPQKLNYQGKLTDGGTGAPLVGQHSLVLKLYIGAVGGDTLWTEAQTVAADSQGVFSCMLGAEKPIAVTLGSSCWLEVQVDGETLQPRRELVSVPYALAADRARDASHASEAEHAASADHASSADSLGGIAAGAFPDGYSLDAADGNPMDAVYVDNSGNVGIGTASPARKLHILGEGPRVLIEGSAGNPELNFKLSGDASSQVWALYKHSVSGDLRFFQNGDRLTIKSGTGAVGIGTADPSLAKLTVLETAGNAVCGTTNGGIGVYGFSDTGTGVSGASNTGRAGAFTGDVFVSGDLGVGVAEPSEKVDIAGNLNLSGYLSIMTEPVLMVTVPDQLKVGRAAGPNSVGISNTFVGNVCGYKNTEGDRDTFVGCRAGQDNIDGYNNTFVGVDVGLANVSGVMNTYVGELAGARDENGWNNTYVGSRAGSDGTTGSRNTFLGSYAGEANEGSSNVFVGYHAGSNEAGSDKLYIANDEDTSRVLIYGDFATGRIGLGTLAPERKLHILGDAPRILIESTGGSPEINFENTDDASAQRWAIYKHFADDDLRFYQNGDRVSIQNGTGNVGIGTTSPGSYKLYVNGEAYSTVAWQSSDARLKTDLAPITGALYKVMQLNGLSFLWRAADYPDRGFPAGRHYGLVAQEVEQVLPEVVKEGADGEKAVAYTELIPVLVESIKELKAESDDLRAASEALRAENAALKARLSALETAAGRSE